uniref:Uncharacterized protein n=1 Tax=Solanum tuberosum TaxID=4113 RepID=M1DBN4_SOLTU
MAEGNGGNSAEMKNEVKRDFTLPALVTPLIELATKITEVEIQWKRQGSWVDLVESFGGSPNVTHAALNIVPNWMFESVSFGEKPWVAERTRRLTENMVRTNLSKPPQKKSNDITINEGGSNPPKRRGDGLQPGDKGKRKKHIAKKGATIEPDFSEPEYEQPLINRRDALQARSQPTATNLGTLSISCTAYCSST